MENMRGTLLPSEKELKYFRKQFVQSAKLQGRVGNFYQVVSVTARDTDQDYEYKTPVEVAYHLNETPSRRFLTKYGWFVEGEPLPIILTLPYYDIKNQPIEVDEGAKITLSGKRSIGKDDILTKEFLITKITTDLEMNQAVCQITPVRELQEENVKVLADKKDVALDNVYLRRDTFYKEED